MCAMDERARLRVRMNIGNLALSPYFFFVFAG